MKETISTLILFCITTSSFSQQPEKIKQIQELTDSIEKIMKQEHITGLMLGITTKDSVLFSGGLGYADLNTKRRVDKSTLFRMGSITKMFVSLAVMKLVNEKKLKLNDELKKIAPEVPAINKWEATNPVRIVNLLEHTTGFDDIKLNRLYAADREEKKGIDMMLVQKNSMICRWKPGERFAYSNPNYAVLGYLIEKISGKPYDQYLTENILTPLGMMNSNFNVRSKLPQKDVKEYTVKDGQTIPVKSVTLLSGPQGALWSNAEDMLVFLQLFLRNGSPLFPGSMITEIETTHSSLAARRGQHNGYSLGNDNTFFTHAKYSFRGHGGLAGTCFSSCLYNRELGIGFVIASNSNNNNSRVQELVVSYLQQNLPRRELETQSIDKKVIEPFLGRYQFESPRNEIAAFSDKLQNAPRIYIQNDKLYIKPLLGDPSELVQTAPMIFAWRGTNMPLVCFTKNDNGKNVMLIGGTYYEQTPNFWAMLKRVIIIIALVFVLSTALLGIGSLIRLLIGKNKRRDAIVRIIPMIGVGLLLWAVFNLLEVQQHTYLLSELVTINFRTAIIFLGTSAFGIISVVSLLYSIKTFHKQGKRWFAIYLLLTSISMCLITAILWQNGWVGLRTWAL
ncbi:MAG TPA: serine hydrolase domain-containing protein [Flavisolibacter sp.]|jgi:CubicO group peptidase (beta-lactamase class C family)|nr:serine hydrolase domain-containing protein [Flavisolibacter sp.]